MVGIGKYSRIDQVTLVDTISNATYPNCYLLTGKDVDDGFEVDLTGDLDFNILSVVKRKTVAYVSNLDEVVTFLERNCICTNISQYLVEIDGEKAFLKVGGEKDMLVFSELDHNWLENIGVSISELSEDINACDNLDDLDAFLKKNNCTYEGSYYVDTKDKPQGVLLDELKRDGQGLEDVESLFISSLIPLFHVVVPMSNGKSNESNITFELSDWDGMGIANVTFSELKDLVTGERNDMERD